MQTPTDVPSELSEKNYRRITLINWVTILPLLILFAWPYYFACQLLGAGLYTSLLGSTLFALPFTATILHGHVTMALGSLHRHHYYRWLSSRPFTYGLLFHELFISTRFRLIILLLSLVLLAVGVS